MLGARVEPALFAQLHERPDIGDRPILEVLLKRGLERSRAHSALRRYELDRAAQNPFELLSGGQQARFQILLMELDSPTMLLLDEPTDNLDVASADALEARARPLRGHRARRDARPLVHATARSVPVLRRGRHGAASCSSRPTTWRCGERTRSRWPAPRCGSAAGSILGPFDLVDRRRRAMGAARAERLRQDDGAQPDGGAGGNRRPDTVEVLGRAARADRRARAPPTDRSRIPPCWPTRCGATHRSSTRSCTGRDATLVTWWQTFDDDDVARAYALLASVGCDDARRPAARDVLARRAPTGADRAGAVR